jgi:hypothetical protein
LRKEQEALDEKNADYKQIEMAGPNDNETSNNEMK